METLEYLDPGGTVKFTYVPWRVLNDWLSELNGNPHVAGSLREGVNRGKVIAEFEVRRNKTGSVLGQTLKAIGRDRGYGQDWREHENDQGYTHFEELLMYQPLDWRKQAREYIYRFDWDLARNSCNEEKRKIKKSIALEEGPDVVVPILLASPVLAVLFHPEMARTSRYEPLNLLLAYGVQDPLPDLLLKLNLEGPAKESMMKELSPLDYFFDFQKNCQTYSFDKLRDIGLSSSFPRLCLLKELDFSDIIGQRLAKQMVRKEIVGHIWSRSINKEELCSKRQPLSMIFAGPSGNGKTELAVWLAKLMNKPGDDAFLKVDCGQLTSASELFGMSGSYQGAYEGSALNNFILRMSLEPDALGIVLLDEIEKARRGVIHGLYQVIDKGEWTNKKLEEGKGVQTETISCHNIIFIMTTNASDNLILEYAKKHDIYTADQEDLEEMKSELETLVRKKLQKTHPFTDAFMGRVRRVVPFLPMANGDPEDNALLGEMVTVAKLLIEREQEKLSAGGKLDVSQLVSSSMKHKMAKIIVKEAIVENGVRSIQLGVETKMGDEVMHSLVLERGGINSGTQIRYSANEEERKIDFRVETSGALEENHSGAWENDADLFG